jgi:Bacterial regulatory helix-turn-helix protein, lysR family
VPSLDQMGVAIAPGLTALTRIPTAQPSLSRQIQQMGNVLGVRLFERTRQGSHLTAAGEAFLPEALSLLRAAERAADRTRSAGSSGTLLIGYTGNLIVTPGSANCAAAVVRCELDTFPNQT